MTPIKWFLCALMLFGFTGCAVSGQREDAEMYRHASALTKLAAALEASVRYNTPPDSAADRQLLEFATAHDPSLLMPFNGLSLKAMHADRHGIVMLCDGPANRALMQDLGCTAEMDDRIWITSPTTACRIDMDAIARCP